ncbi:DNA polymerase IV [Selenomonas sp. CM52]|uniref:DNA polymerase IV n=1 Tax=Selenomonas sp. CM52 TaxID=936381 RepID=UPI00027C6854|nr:DNA polymerase IV [Selenomonas sp. CM52]EJU29812.1 ImpB/MucB/SamB family protein [Selenomonas sp. CM52]
MQRTILHVDMDAFFAAVEQREHPEYRGKPVIVGGLSSRGVVATASYEARRSGVHSAMPMETARRRCPDGIFVQGNYALYRAVSAEIFAIFSRYSPLVEPLSIDEAFLDVTGMGLLAPSPRVLAQRLKAEIREKTALVASVGIAPNKFLAKLASDLEKPDGLVEIRAEDAVRRIAPLPVRRLWGVGRRTEEKLLAQGIKTIGEVQKADEKKLARSLGRRAAHALKELSFGRDERRVEPDREAKSIGKEVTFERDLESAEEAERELLSLAEKVGWRLRLAGVAARTIQLKVRRADFTTFTRSRTLFEATAHDEPIFRTARDLFRELGIKSGIRLLGVTGENFEPSALPSLFRDEKKERLYGAIDALKKRFGESIITKAPLIDKNPQKE